MNTFSRISDLVRIAAEVSQKQKGATMTAAQMAWNLKKGFAWEEQEGQDWRMPIWTKDGGWIWDTTEQKYILELV